MDIEKCNFLRKVRLFEFLPEKSKSEKTARKVEKLQLFAKNATF